MLIYNQIDSIEHNNYEQQALSLINNERKQAGLTPLKLLDELTRLTNFKINQVTKCSNINNYIDDSKKQNIYKVLNYYNINNCKNIYEYIFKGYNSVDDVILALISNKNQKDVLLNPNINYFSLGYIRDNNINYWYNICAFIPENIEQSVLDKYRQEVIDLVNEERKKAGLNIIIRLEPLMKAANIRAKEQAEKPGHIRPNNTSCFTVVDDVNFKLQGNYFVGENVASGQLSPKEVMDGWMNSPLHRKNILSPEYEHIGIGIYSQNGNIYWVQIFYKGKV